MRLHLSQDGWPVLLAAGVIILLWALDVIRGNIVWIIVGALVIANGLQKILRGFCRCCDKD